MSGGSQLEFINKLKALSGDSRIGYIADELLPSILDKVAKHLDRPARFYASGTPDEFLNFTGYTTTAGDGTGKILPPDANNLVGTSITAGTISLKTGVVTGGTPVTINGFAFSIPATTYGYKRRMVIAQDSTGFKVKFGAEISGPYSYSNHEDPGTLWGFLTETTPVMFIDLESYNNAGSTAFKTAGSVTNVIENAVSGVPRIFDIGGGADGNSNLQNQIDALQVQLDAIAANNPAQQKFTSTGGQTLFDATLFTWNSLSTVLDIEVWIDGRRQLQDTNGLLFEGFRKNSISQIELAQGVIAGKEVVIWKQGTALIGGGGGGQGLTQSNPANKFYLLDQGDLTTIWKMEVINGVLGIVAV